MKSTIQNIKCIVKFAVQNSKEADCSLLRALKEARYPVISANCNVYSVFNISLETAKYYCGKYNLTSFVFIELCGESDFSYYYEKQDTVKPYSKVNNPFILCNTVKGGSNVSLPAVYEYHERIYKNFMKEESQKIIRGRSLDECLDYAINRVGMSPLIMRNTLYKDL